MTALYELPNADGATGYKLRNKQTGLATVRRADRAFIES